ncbi:hypothetical protein JTB14_004558 [Gonioctena quinquepunctata]|nr:hypothetical protein JTB14_004558 [Gonioctena quinquepunctata]
MILTKSNMQNFDTSSLPPCSAEFQPHIRRAAIIANILKSAHLQTQLDIDAANSGWTLSNDSEVLELTWFEGSQLPDPILDSRFDETLRLNFAVRTVQFYRSPIGSSHGSDHQLCGDCAGGNMDMNDEDVLAVVESKERSTWCEQWLRKRRKYSHMNISNELKFALRDWHNYLRMTEETYFNLLALVTPLIKKQGTIMRQYMSPHERLTATLRFLATGLSYECLKFSTIISPQALSHIISETCDALYTCLRKDYLKNPEGVYRSKDSLRKSYDNSKGALRKDVADEENEFYITGGGSPESKILCKAGHSQTL